MKVSSFSSSLPFFHFTNCVKISFLSRLRLAVNMLNFRINYLMWNLNSEPFAHVVVLWFTAYEFVWFLPPIEDTEKKTANDNENIIKNFSICSFQSLDVYRLLQIQNPNEKRWKKKLLAQVKAIQSKSNGLKVFHIASRNLNGALLDLANTASVKKCLSDHHSFSLFPRNVSKCRHLKLFE